MGHHTGYRNFECPDAARNILPWGLLIGGEELHNNHHAFPSSAKFSIRRWELDIGWLYIRLFQALGMAKVIRVAPQPASVAPRQYVDFDALRAVIVNRMHVSRDYARRVIVPVFHEFRERLHVLWSSANLSNECLLLHLRDWVAQAETSGIRSLQEFAQSLRGYALQPA